MNYYHMTSLDRIKPISKIGLIPRNEENSRLINDTKSKVFFSEGFEGAIALFVDFDIVYRNIKNRQVKLQNKELENKVLNSKNIYEYLKDGVYLQFDGTHIKNERNFENGCTDKVILPEKLNVCVLRSMRDNSVIFSRFEIIKYMMSKIKVEEIRYYGNTYDGSPSFNEATKKVQGKVQKYYNTHKEEIEKYKNYDYSLEYIPIREFVNKYLK